MKMQRGPFYFRERVPHK